MTFHVRFISTRVAVILCVLCGVSAVSTDIFFNTTNYERGIVGPRLDDPPPQITLGVINGLQYYVYSFAHGSAVPSVSLLVSTPEQLVQEVTSYSTNFAMSRDVAVASFNSSRILTIHEEDNNRRAGFLYYNEMTNDFNRSSTDRPINTRVNPVQSAFEVGSSHIAYTYDVSGNTDLYYKIENIDETSQIMPFFEKSKQKQATTTFLTKINDECFVLASAFGMGNITLAFFDGQNQTDPLFEIATSGIANDIRLVHNAEMERILLHYMVGSDETFLQIFSYDCNVKFDSQSTMVTGAYGFDKRAIVSVGESQKGPFVIVIAQSDGTVHFFSSDNIDSSMGSISKTTTGSVVSIDAVFNHDRCEMVIVTRCNGVNEMAIITTGAGFFDCTEPPSVGTTEPPNIPTPPQTTNPPSTIAPTSTSLNILPRLDCVLEESAGKYVAILGWDTMENTRIPYGQNNIITPTPLDTSIVPTLFEGSAAFFPSTEPFRYDFDGQSTSWTLGEGVVTFSSASPKCITDEATVDFIIAEPFPLDDTTLLAIQIEVAKGMGVNVSDITVSQSATPSSKRQTSTTVSVTITDSAVSNPVSVVSDFTNDEDGVKRTTDSINTNAGVTVTAVTIPEPPTVTKGTTRFTPTSDSMRTRVLRYSTVTLFVSCSILLASINFLFK